MTTQAPVKRGPGRPRKDAQMAPTQDPLSLPGHTLVLSRFQQHMVVLQSKRMDRVTGALEDVGRTLKFEDYKAHCPNEWLEDFYKTEAYRLEHVGTIERPPTKYKGTTPLDTTRGSMTAGAKRATPPIAEWDTMPQDELREVISVGGFDKMGALNWETSHNKRPWVILELSQHMQSIPLTEAPVLAEDDFDMPDIPMPEATL